MTFSSYFQLLTVIFQLVIFLFQSTCGSEHVYIVSVQFWSVTKLSRCKSVYAALEQTLSVDRGSKSVMHWQEQCTREANLLNFRYGSKECKRCLRKHDSLFLSSPWSKKAALIWQRFIKAHLAKVFLKAMKHKQTSSLTFTTDLWETIMPRCTLPTLPTSYSIFAVTLTTIQAAKFIFWSNPIT